MSGKISFHFSNTQITDCETVLAAFRRAGAVGCVVCSAQEMADGAALCDLQASGWEIIADCDGQTPDKIGACKKKLEGEGFYIRLCRMPMTTCDGEVRALLQKHYDGAFTAETDGAGLTAESLIIQRPF